MFQRLGSAVTYQPVAMQREALELLKVTPPEELRKVANVVVVQLEDFNVVLQSCEGLGADPRDVVEAYVKMIHTRKIISHLQRLNTVVA